MRFPDVGASALASGVTWGGIKLPVVWSDDEHASTYVTDATPTEATRTFRAFGGKRREAIPST
jgi:hypothetical protein